MLLRASNNGPFLGLLEREAEGEGGQHETMKDRLLLMDPRWDSIMLVDTGPIRKKNDGG